jgi:glycosyltransferase involved in cell wall biosynthesis
MKIAMVSEHASPLATLGGEDAGGQNVHVAALSRALADRGHEVAVYTRRDDPTLTEEVTFGPGVTVVHVPAGPSHEIPKDDLLPWMPEFGRRLRQRLLADTPDIVHSHFWMSGLAALEAAREVGAPIVHTFHALGTVKRRHQGRADTSPPERIERESMIGRSVDAVIATCEDEVRELIRMKVPRRTACVVPCGVDLRSFAPDEVVKVRRERPRLLSIGRLVPRKGVDTAIHALRHVPDAELLIAGGPPADLLDEDPEVRRLRRIAEKAGVADRTRFLGRVTRPDVPALMRSADLVVTVPWYEPFGIVPLEAMACGVPVVASAVGGHLSTVVSGVTGLLVPPRRPAVLGKALRKLLADPLMLTAYGIAAADRARSRYGWNRVAAETFAAYTRVLRRRTAAGSVTGAAERSVR